MTTVTVDLADARAASWLLDDHMPDEIYHLAAHSSVHSSFHIPAETFASNAVATTNLLETIRTRRPDTRFYHASTSEMFGEAPEVPQTETTLFRPRSPYAVAQGGGAPDDDAVPHCLWPVLCQRHPVSTMNRRCAARNLSRPRSCAA